MVDYSFNSRQSPPINQLTLRMIEGEWQKRKEKKEFAQKALQGEIEATFNLSKKREATSDIFHPENYQKKQKISTVSQQGQFDMAKLFQSQQRTRREDITTFQIAELLTSYQQLLFTERQLNIAKFEALRNEYMDFQSRMLKEVVDLKDTIHRVASANHASIPQLSNEAVLLPKLPLNDEVDLTAFENWLASTENYTEALRIMSRVGGPSSGKIVRNILRKLLSDELANGCTLLGKYGKLRFKDLRSYQLLIDATRGHGLAQLVSDSEIDNFIIDWLRTSNSRIKIRSRRLQNPSPPNSPECPEIGSSLNEISLD